MDTNFPLLSLTTAGVPSIETERVAQGNFWLHKYTEVPHTPTSIVLFICYRPTREPSSRYFSGNLWWISYKITSNFRTCVLYLLQLWWFSNNCLKMWVGVVSQTRLIPSVIQQKGIFFLFLSRKWRTRNSVCLKSVDMDFSSRPRLLRTMNMLKQTAQFTWVTMNSPQVMNVPDKSEGKLLQSNYCYSPIKTDKKNVAREAYWTYRLWVFMIY